MKILIKKLFIYFLVTIFLLQAISVSSSIHLAPKMLKSPNDFSYEVGTTGHDVTWAFEAHESNDDPGTYDVEINGTVLPKHNDEPWSDGEDIVVNVSGLELGVHIVKITVRDSGFPDNADAATDEVKVTVVEEGGEVTTDTSDDTIQNRETEERLLTSPLLVMNLVVILSVYYFTRFKNSRENNEK